MRLDGMTYEEAMEWVEYNNIRVLPYMKGPHSVEPIVNNPK